MSVTFRITEHALGLACAARPPGFCAEIRTLGKFEAGMFEVARAHWFAVHRKHATAAIPQEPTISDMLRNFSGAMLRWAGAGLPIVSREQWSARMAVCDACPHWVPTARAGLGLCGAPGCGCTRFKHWLATEKCPLGKWPGV
jgi:hypothetical protein